MEHGTMARASKPYRGRRIDAPLEVKLAGWNSAPFVQEERQAHARELAQEAARKEAEHRQREVDRMAAALRHANTLQRHQQDAARLNALANALLGDEQ
jgi:hypothetical protein